jgi:hypothetical protein
MSATVTSTSTSIGVVSDIKVSLIGSGSHSDDITSTLRRCLTRGIPFDLIDVKDAASLLAKTPTVPHAPKRNISGLSLDDQRVAHSFHSLLSQLCYQLHQPPLVCHS